MPGGLIESLQTAQEALLSPWNRVSLEAAANIRYPELPVRSAWVLDTDMRILWFRWLIEGIIPPDSSTLSDPDLAAALIGSAEVMLEVSSPLLNRIERSSTARLIAQIAYNWVNLDKVMRARFTSSDKKLVLLEAGDPPRCWICREPFSELAIKRFIRESREPLTANAIVDCFYPRGLNSNDFECQIDHVRPVAAGGGNDIDNLRLSCGFCNRTKSDSLDIYARAPRKLVITHPTYGELRAPHPYWICRMLAVDGRCSECSSDSRKVILRAAPSRPAKFVNPSNLQLFCDQHDPYSEVRWVSSNLLRPARSS